MKTHWIAAIIMAATIGICFAPSREAIFSAGSLGFFNLPPTF
jgi:hypothetical protein